MLKKIVMGIGIIGSLVVNAYAVQSAVKNKTDEIFCEKIEHIPAAIREYEMCKNLSQEERMVLLGRFEGTENFFNKIYGSMDTSSLKILGTSTITSGTGWKQWFVNYREFICSLNDNEIYKLISFLEYSSTFQY